MSSSVFNSSLYALSFILLVQTAVGAANPLLYSCSTSAGNFTANGPYETNLKKLFGALYLKTPPSGFGMDSVGPYQTRAYGLSLCRGDVSTEDCKACVAEASDEILNRCPYNKGAAIWYDNCLFKYSDSDFFGKIDNGVKLYMWNVHNVTYPKEFNGKTKTLLSKLAVEAQVTPKLYAGGEAELGGAWPGKKLYGLAQCTRDLSSVDCNKCLDGMISELPSCCDGKEGGRILGGSCNIRYEIYPFLSNA